MGLMGGIFTHKSNAIPTISVVWDYDAEKDNNLLDSKANMWKIYIALVRIYISKKRDIIEFKFGIQVPRMLRKV